MMYKNLYKKMCNRHVDLYQAVEKKTPFCVVSATVHYTDPNWKLEYKINILKNPEGSSADIGIRADLIKPMIFYAIV